MNQNVKKAIKIIVSLLCIAFVVLAIIARRTKKDSIYDNAPEEKNPMEGKKAVFIESGEDKENADGVRGHLETVGESEYHPGFYEKYVKRLIDIILSFAGLVILSPVFAVIAVAIKIEDPGPVFFTQKRVGQNKQYFKLHKFRTMKVSTPHDVPTHMLKNPEQYITRVGAYLRRHSLDELPQIWDIFVGNLTTIGPRPGLWNQDLLIAERERYGANDVKPGLTGWAQINGRDELEITEKAKLDGEYVKKMGLMMDIKCFLGSLHVIGKDKSVVEGGTGEMKKNKQDIDQSDKVSIIMPSYNTASFIQESIQSVIDQTYENWELIIIDDCSDDNTDAILSAISDTRIKVLRNRVNSGAAYSRNKGLREATGRWIAFLDSDDIWLPEKLEKQISYMNNNDYHFSYTNYVEVDEEGRPNGTFVTGPRRINKTLMYSFNYMGCLTVMYDRDYVGLVQIENLKKRNDYALWIKVVDKCPAHLLDETLAQYRVRNNGSVMDRSRGPVKRIQFNYYLWNQGEKKNKVEAILLTGLNLIFGTWKTLFYKKREIKNG